MKKSHIIFVAVMLMMVSGCDFFRKVAGRPTSSEIEAKREHIAKLEIGQQDECNEKKEAYALPDTSLEKQVVADHNAQHLTAEVMKPDEEKAIADSLEAIEILKKNNCVMFNLSRHKGVSSGKLSHRYYIIVGSFRDAANADKFMTKVAQDPTMEPVKMHFRTGMDAIGVCPRNKLSEIADVIGYVKDQKFCPKDAWVLVNQE